MQTIGIHKSVLGKTVINQFEILWFHNTVLVATVGNEKKVISAQEAETLNGR